MVFVAHWMVPKIVSHPDFAASFSMVYFYLGVSKNRGKTPKWMVKIMENPI